MSHHEAPNAGHKRKDQPKICEEGHRLCVPKMMRGPSGVRLRHDWSCSAHPGEAINLREYARGRTGSWPPRGSVA